MPEAICKKLKKKIIKKNCVCSLNLQFGECVHTCVRGRTAFVLLQWETTHCCYKLNEWHQDGDQFTFQNRFNTLFSQRNNTVNSLSPAEYDFWGWRGGQTFKIKMLCYYSIGPYYCVPSLTDQHMLLLIQGKNILPGNRQQLNLYLNFLMQENQ